MVILPVPSGHSLCLIMKVSQAQVKFLYLILDRIGYLLHDIIHLQKVGAAAPPGLQRV